MRTLLESLQLAQYSINKIIIQLDENSNVSFDCGNNFILESNRKVWTSSDGENLKIGDHATQREDRPVERGGDGEHINEQEIINMFIYAWKNIILMTKTDIPDPNQKIQSDWVDIKKPAGEHKYPIKIIKVSDDKGRSFDGNTQYSYTIQCCAWLKNENGKIIYDGARPLDKTLYAAFSVNKTPNKYKYDIIIRTIFRGGTHGTRQFKQNKYEQQRIIIKTNGEIINKYKMRNITL